MACKYMVEEIERLGQDEGLNDREISEILGCSSITVSRIRYKHNIPTANLRNKKDKKYVCAKCGKVVFIRRHERRKAFCDECTNEQLS